MNFPRSIRHWANLWVVGNQQKTNNNSEHVERPYCMLWSQVQYPVEEQTYFLLLLLFTQLRKTKHDWKAVTDWLTQNLIDRPFSFSLSPLFLSLSCFSSRPSSSCCEIRLKTRVKLPQKMSERKERKKENNAVWQNKQTDRQTDRQIEQGTNYWAEVRLLAGSLLQPV